MKYDKLEQIKYLNNIMESGSHGQKVWASEKLYEVYQEENEPEAELPQELMKHMDEVLKIIEYKNSKLKQIAEKLLNAEMKPNEQLIKVLKGELLTPAKDMTENLVPNLKRLMKSLKNRNDKNIGFNNIEISKKEDE